MGPGVCDIKMPSDPCLEQGKEVVGGGLGVGTTRLCRHEKPQDMANHQEGMGRVGSHSMSSPSPVLVWFPLVQATTG